MDGEVRLFLSFDMRLTEILDLIRHGEGPRTEFKREVGDLRVSW